MRVIARKYFENLTMVPIEKDLIHEKLLNTEEKKWQAFSNH